VDRWAEYPKTRIIVRIEIEATDPAGLDESKLRTVSENARTSSSTSPASRICRQSCPQPDTRLVEGLLARLEPLR
jgi:hypothetical protein